MMSRKIWRCSQNSKLRLTSQWPKIMSRRKIRSIMLRNWSKASKETGTSSESKKGSSKKSYRSSLSLIKVKVLHSSLKQKMKKKRRLIHETLFPLIKVSMLKVNLRMAAKKLMWDHRKYKKKVIYTFWNIEILFTHIMMKKLKFCKETNLKSNRLHKISRMS